MEFDIDLYKQMIESSIEGVWIVDANNQTVYVNPSMAKMLGYSHEEVSQKNLSYFMKPEEFIDLMNKFETRKVRTSELHECRFIKKDQTHLWTKAACNPLYNHSGEYIGSIGMITDITEKKRSEAILTAQSNVFKILVSGGSLEMALNELLKPIEELVDGVLASILILNKEGKKFVKGVSRNLPQTFIDKIIEEDIGLTAGSCGAAAFLKEMVVVSDIATDPRWKKYKDLAQEHGLKVSWSSPIISRDGKVLGTFAMYFNEAKEPSEFEGQIVKDVIAAAALSIEHLQLIHRMEERTKETELLADARKILANSIEYEKVLKNIPELIVSYFADWCFISLADDVGKLHVQTAAATPETKERLKEFESYKADKRAPHGLARATREGRSLLYSHVTDDDLNLEINEWPVIGTKNPRYVKIVRDVGLKSYMAIPMIVRGEVLGGMIVASFQEGRHYTQEDLKLMDEIVHSCTMAIDNAVLYRESQRTIQNRENLISVASHELRTPLTSLKMRIDLLVRLIETSKFPSNVMEKLAPIVSEIQPDVQKFTKLIEALLDVSRITNKKLQLSFQEVNISKVITDEIKRIENDFKVQNCPLIVNIEDNVIGECDPLRLQQVISNLLINALKFGNKKPVEMQMKADEDKVIFTIKDLGIGVAPEDKWRIFKPFERAVSDRYFGGLGLGLYISQQIVEEHKGSIYLESAPGQGSTFVVELPRRQH
ncbi:MAG: ATP-binding protein [Bacteriovoracaceae bacterium]|nr:ATP-binding protein [Bacteriovoracaceae bacterium]